MNAFLPEKWLSTWRQWLWEPTRPGHGLTRIVRLLYVVVREMLDGQIGLRAMSLVYTTLLSLVPLLAVSFSLLKAFDVHSRIEPFLLQALAPLGEKASEISARILDFVGNVRVGLIGSLGLAMLIYTVISLVQKTEDAFNFIWRVPQRRSLARRFSDYLSVLLVGPLLVFSALGLTATLASNSAVQWILAMDTFGLLFLAISKLAPYLLVIVAFTFFYLFIVNTKVRFLPALVGGVVAGVCWQAVGRAFALITVNSGNLDAIYSGSGFAVLILFMFWLYLSWLILLFGALVAYYVQYPDQVSLTRQEPELSAAQRRELALTLLAKLARQYLQGLQPHTMQELQDGSGASAQVVNETLGRLQKTGYVLETAREPAEYVLAKDPALIGLYELLDRLHKGVGGFHHPVRLPSPDPVGNLLLRLEQATAQALGNLTLKDLAAEIAAATDQPRKA